MRNIPDFSCEYGAAQLILEEIPTSGKAYCMVHWVLPGQVKALLSECAQFCTFAGAEQVFALGNDLGEEDYPLAFQVISMRAQKERLAQSTAALFPVVPELGENYLKIYHNAMKQVDGARQIKTVDQLLKLGKAYFIHRGEMLLGIGQVEENRILALASTLSGAGAEVLCALAETIWADTVELTVADTNEKAIRLYEKLGFLSTGVEESWYRIR